VKCSDEIEESLLRYSGGCDDAYYHYAQSFDQCLGECKLLLQHLHWSIGIGCTVFRILLRERSGFGLWDGWIWYCFVRVGFDSVDFVLGMRFHQWGVVARFLFELMGNQGVCCDPCVE